jgi:beta-phosphoglucomutase family hydrolase
VEERDLVTRERFDAVLFDLDGVLTDTARIHAACWKTMFDAFLEARSAEGGERFAPFEIESDYRQYVDGKPRLEGVRDFLRSRGIELPEGSPDAPAEEDSLHGLGNRKDLLVQRALASGKVEAFPGAVAWLRWLHEREFRLAVVSSSHNCRAVLESAGIAHLFETRVDGNVADERRLPGKPRPDTFLEAAKRLGVTPERSVVVEDALAGVEAGRAGEFGLVIGVARHGDADALLAAGADVAVADVGELVP